MPLKRMLEEGRSFGPKAVALLLEAFDGIVAELDLRSAADREKAAKIVMRLALGQARLDGAKLRGKTAARAGARARTKTRFVETCRVGSRHLDGGGRARVGT